MILICPIASSLLVLRGQSEKVLVENVTVYRDQCCCLSQTLLTRLHSLVPPSQQRLYLGLCQSVVAVVTAGMVNPSKSKLPSMPVLTLEVDNKARQKSSPTTTAATAAKSTLTTSSSTKTGSGTTKAKQKSGAKHAAGKA